MTVVQRPPDAMQASSRGTTVPMVGPQRLHHLAYVTMDTEATADFYTRVMGMPLVNAILDSEVPSTREPFPYFHSFFRLASGETIAFFECPGTPPVAPKAHPAHRTFEHLALEVPSRADVEAWRAWLEANGIEVIDAEHGIIYSIYFFDPVNDIRLEITTTLQPDWNAQEANARAALDAWATAKREARADGKDVPAALREMAIARSASARRRAAKT